MTKKVSPGECGVVVVYDGSVAVVCVGVVGDLDVLFVVVVFDPAADAEPATNTDSVTPRENTTSVMAPAATALRRGVGLLTTHLRCRCRSPVAPGSRALRGADRVGPRSHCGPHAPPDPRSSAEGRRR